MKWQQVSGTAEQKIPFEVICLVEAMQSGDYDRAYVVLGGEGWKRRGFYTGGSLKKYLYLIDETTAVTRFIFPCREDELDKVRFLFITQLVSGKDEIWVVESGMRNRVHIWRPSDN